MSTHTKVPWLASLAVIALFTFAVVRAVALQRNTANQVVRALMLTTAGVPHTSGTTTVYYHTNATNQVSSGTATHVGNEVRAR